MQLLRLHRRRRVGAGNEEGLVVPITDSSCGERVGSPKTQTEDSEFLGIGRLLQKVHTRILKDNLAIDQIDQKGRKVCMGSCPGKCLHRVKEEIDASPSPSFAEGNEDLIEKAQAEALKEEDVKKERMVDQQEKLELNAHGEGSCLAEWFSYNNSYHASMGMPPYEMLYAGGVELLCVGVRSGRRKLGSLEGRRKEEATMGGFRSVDSETRRVLRPLEADPKTIGEEIERERELRQGFRPLFASLAAASAAEGAGNGRRLKGLATRSRGYIICPIPSSFDRGSSSAKIDK
ncbi:hypothetical protein L1987_21970 [Smallanthus sonchifolius]|uniref:Uncharacterized protein n=1 Tax=Smallanthus sonchifolius TaxID=185202 RepID=A0ACB9ICV4_9ASTR|nr:hypothetical protein L1987_21970 [Smallanthus sonchifolius]